MLISYESGHTLTQLENVKHSKSPFFWGHPVGTFIFWVPKIYINGFEPQLSLQFSNMVPPNILMVPQAVLASLQLFCYSEPY